MRDQDHHRPEIEPEWMSLLRAEIAKSTVTAVAVKMGVGRSSLSNLLRGKYRARPDNIRVKFFRAFGDGKFCPHLKRQISEAECSAFSDRSRPHQADEFDHWLACKGCPLCPGRPQRSAA